MSELSTPEPIQAPELAMEIRFPVGEDGGGDDDDAEEKSTDDEEHKE